MAIDTEIDSTLQHVAESHGTRVRCSQNTTLFDPGSTNISFYRLLSGSAAIVLHHPVGTVEAMTLEPLEWVGQSPIAVDDTYNFSLCCISDSEFEKVDWQTVDIRSQEYEAATTEFDGLAHKLHTIHLLIQTFYKTYENVSVEFLEELIRSAHFTRLAENETLFEQGDSAQVMYFLLSGKIDVYVGESDQLTRVGEIFHGEPFGEMSLFSNERRSATLVATRSSDLISLDRQSFDRLSIKFPWLSTYIVSSLVNRVKKQNERIKSKFQPVNRLLLNCSPDRLESVAGRLAALLRQSEDSVITQGRVNQRFGSKGVADLTHSQLINYLDGLEQNHSKNIYFADFNDSDWTKICLERTDEVWILAEYTDDSGQLDHALEQYKQLYSWQKQKKRLALAHQDMAKIKSSRHWIDRFGVEQHFHIDANSAASLQRLARYLTDKSLGLVLGGGGARGLAQVGIFKAMEEANITVDWVGGTSIGSVIGGWIAMGWNSAQITEAVKRFFVSVNPLGDYTLPVVSLSKSHRLDSLLQQGFGETVIEDLPIPFFCVSSDMSMAEEKHHEAGLLWKAIRASISIPGVIAPVIDEGHYLVDGGLFNNLPCDLMRQRNNGPIAAIDVSPDEEYLTKLRIVPSPWQIMLNRLLGRQQPRVPSILETLLRSSMLASTQRQKANRAMVDYFIQPDIRNVGMLDFKQAEVIIESGYQEGLRALETGMNDLIRRL